MGVTLILSPHWSRFTQDLKTVILDPKGSIPSTKTQVLVIQVTVSFSLLYKSSKRYYISVPSRKAGSFLPMISSPNNPVGCWGGWSKVTQWALQPGGDLPSSIWQGGPVESPPRKKRHGVSSWALYTGKQHAIGNIFHYCGVYPISCRLCGEGLFHFPKIQTFRKDKVRRSMEGERKSEEIATPSINCWRNCMAGYAPYISTPLFS